MTQKTFEEIYTNVFTLLKNLLGDRPENQLIRMYEQEIVDKGKGNPRFVHTINELVAMKKQYKSKKIPSKYAFERLRKDSVYLTQEMIEFGQRRELGLLQKTKVVINAKGKGYDLFLTKPAFLVGEKGVRKIEGGKIYESSPNEMNKTMSTYKGGRIMMSHELLDILKKELGEFEINL